MGGGLLHALRRGPLIGLSGLALIGVVNLPIIKFSVDWWTTLHQPDSILRAGGPSMAPLRAARASWRNCRSSFVAVSMSPTARKWPWWYRSTIRVRAARSTDRVRD